MSNGLVNLRIGYGTANFSSCSMQISAQKVSAPFIRVPALTSGTRQHGTATRQNLSPHGDINGTLYSDAVGHRPGTMIVLTVSRRRKGSSVADGAIILRLRPTAPMLSISVKLPMVQDNYFGQNFNMFTGNADIMSVEEAEVCGLRFPGRWSERYTNLDEINQVFDVVELQAETAYRPEIQAIATPQGVVVSEVAPAPRRRINIRK